MNWFKQNKFLGGLLIFTLLGVGVLGYLLFTAKGKYDDNSATFDQQAAELSRLENLPAYPDKQNLEVLESQRVAHLGLIEDLQKSLAAAQTPIEQITPNGFQDQLRTAVTQFVAKAAATPMELPKTGFYMGFGPYQAAPPTPEAAPLLARELKVIQMVLQTLLDNHVVELRDFLREQYAEESGKKPASDTAKTPQRKPGDKPGATADPLVKSHWIDLTFICPQVAFKKVLNTLASSKEQFLIVRYVSVNNSNPHGPPKDLAGAAPGGAPPVAAAPVAPGEVAKVVSPMIFGEEMVEVVLRLEIVDFAKPAPAATPAPRGNR